MPNLTPLTSAFEKLTFTAALDILVVAVLLYQLIMIIRGRRAAHILSGLGVLVLAYLVSVWASLELLRAILSNLATYAGFALIVVFQSEIRRMLARIGRRGSFGLRARLQSRESTDEILLALGRLAERHVGGLIVLERDIGLRTFIESGVLIDAAQSRDLLLTIFEPGTALHDGAVIVQRDRISAAACFLPLSMNPTLSRKLGTRHRAAIGVTEETDCLSLVVSEETGRISVAAFGEIEMDVSLKRAGERIMQHFGRRWSAWSHGAGAAKSAPSERGVQAEEEWREAQE
jgi:diadenylate cyclase